MTEVNPDALAVVVELDAMCTKGIYLGPLHGIPILIKNNIATNDKMTNNAGEALLWQRLLYRRRQLVGPVIRNYSFRSDMVDIQGMDSD